MIEMTAGQLRVYTQRNTKKVIFRELGIGTQKQLLRFFFSSYHSVVGRTKRNRINIGRGEKKWVYSTTIYRWCGETLLF